MRSAKIMSRTLRTTRMKTSCYSVCKYGELTTMENWQQYSKSELNMTNRTLHNFGY